jgi:nucleoside-diphosphate-sugar epimerase
MADPTVEIDEAAELAPVSLYAEQKVEVESSLLGATGALVPTCLRFATVYGVAPRMRFDLTVNEFTRDLWADRRLEVFGEQFWRPYVHVRDAGRGIATVLDAPDLTARQVFNVGRSGENYRKLDLVQEIRRVTDRGEVLYVRRDEDPRDYKVSFDKIRNVLGFETEMTVPDGIAEVFGALEQERFGDPFDGRYRNIP